MQPETPNATPIQPSQPSAELLLAAEEQSRAPEVPSSVKINLLGHSEEQAAPAIPQPQPEISKPNRRLPVIIAAIMIVSILSLGLAYGYVALKPKPASKPVTQQPPPTPQPSPPTAQPSPPPPPPAEPQTVTAPAVTPTTENPQMVTVTSKSGLWLRGSPNSSNQDNVIGWIPNGAQVSVDQTGEFWWHGTYKGKTGYFASNYTR